MEQVTTSSSLEKLISDNKDLRARLDRALSVLGDVRNAANSLQHELDDCITTLEFDVDTSKAIEARLPDGTA